jgi:hypothetical protein
LAALADRAGAFDKNDAGKKIQMTIRDKRPTPQAKTKN